MILQSLIVSCFLIPNKGCDIIAAKDDVSQQCMEYRAMESDYVKRYVFMRCHLITMGLGCKKAELDCMSSMAEFCRIEVIKFEFSVLSQRLRHCPDS